MQIFMRQIFLLCFVTTIAFASCTKKLPTKKIFIQKANGEKIALTCEIADDNDEREKGFMFRKKIPHGTGMLFVFQKDELLSFWMKNTPTPLSIAFADSHFVIRDIFDMNAFSTDSVQSSVRCRYALEVPQGYFKSVGIQLGDVLEMEN